MDADLAEKLHQRIRRMQSVESSSETSSTTGNGTSEEFDPIPSTIFNPYVEYHEFSRKQIQNLMQLFDKYDTDKDKSLNFNELKFLMEKLGLPQTHLSLKAMIQHVDEDHNGKISFREFLLIFRKVVSENEQSCILYRLYAMLFEIDVSKEGVGGAKTFFEAKAAAVRDSDKFYREIRDEQEQRRRIEEEKLRRKLAFQTRLAQFQL